MHKILVTLGVFNLLNKIQAHAVVCNVHHFFISACGFCGLRPACYHQCMGLEERQDPSDCQGTLRQGKYMYIEEGGILPVIRWIKGEFRSKNQIGIRSMTIFIKRFKDIVLPDQSSTYLLSSSDFWLLNVHIIFIVYLNDENPIQR